MSEFTARPGYFDDDRRLRDLRYPQIVSEGRLQLDQLLEEIRTTKFERLLAERETLHTDRLARPFTHLRITYLS